MPVFDYDNTYFDLLLKLELQTLIRELPYQITFFLNIELNCSEAKLLVITELANYL